MDWHREECTSFSSQRQIRIAAVPLGHVPPAVFERYFKILQNVSEIPMANLSKPGTWKKEKSPFKYFSWFDGSIVLHFLDRSQNVRPSEWQEYQAHRRIFAVIGLLHLPSCDQAALANVEQELQSKASAFPHAVAKKVFCFGHKFDGGQDLERFINRNDLVVFPPEGDVEPGMSMVELHLNVVLNDLAVVLVTHLEEEVGKTKASSRKSIKRGPWLGLRSPMEDESVSGGGTKESDNKRSTPGRISKWVGDLCLLSGSAQDAAENFLSAINDCKAVNDSLWHAGAIEGFIAALQLMQSYGLSIEEYTGRGDLLTTKEGPKAFLAVVEDKCAEALALLDAQYAWGPLAVELCFKVARLHADGKPTRHVESLSYIMKAMSIVNLPLPVQVMRSLESAALSRLLRLPRKFSFFLRLAAIQSFELQSYTSAHELGRVAAASYGVTFVDDPASSQPPPPPKNFRTVFAAPASGWHSIQKLLLSDLIAFSASARDITHTCAYYLSLLQLLSDLEAQRLRAALLGCSTVLPPLVGGAPSSVFSLFDPSATSPQTPLSARPRLTLDTTEINAEVGTMTTRGAGYHMRSLSKDSDGTDSTFDDVVEDDPRRGLSSSNWQIRSGHQRKGTGLLPSHALRFSFKNRSSVLTPFRAPSSLSTTTTPSTRVGQEGAQAEGEDQVSALEGSMMPQNVAASPEEQEVIIAEMMKLTRRLPPRTPLDTRGFPLVHFVRPLKLSVDLIPVERPGGGAKASSAFIYNPFAAKGTGPVVTWSAGEVTQVAVCVSNPLAAPLHVQNLELLVANEGAGASGGALCYPLTLWVPAYRRHFPITLEIKLPQPGELILRGVKLTVFNMTTQVLIDDQGNAPALAVRSTPRDQYPRRVAYSRAPKNDKTPVGNTAAAGVPTPEGSVATNRVVVVGRLPKLSTRLDQWSTNVELFPGEYRKTVLQLQVNNEVPIGFLEVSVLQKGLGGGGSGPASVPKKGAKVSAAGAKPVTLFTFSMEAEEPNASGSPSRLPLATSSPASPALSPPPVAPPAEEEEEVELCVAIDPLGIDALAETLRGALKRRTCLSVLLLPLLLKRLDRYTDADVVVKYSTSASHRHYRTLTVPLHFHHTDGLQMVGLSVETSSFAAYPSVLRLVEHCHRHHHVGPRPPAALLKKRARRPMHIDTDHARAFLMAEVRNHSNEDLHIKTCLLEETPLPSAARSLPSEVALLQDLTAPTTMVIKPHASRRIVIPFSRITQDSYLLVPPPPPRPPPGGGKAPKPTLTWESPEWARLLHGLCRSLRLHWSDQHNLRQGLLRPSSVMLASTVTPAVIERLQRPPVRLLCSASEPPRPPSPVNASSPAPLSPTPSPSAFTVLRPLLYLPSPSPSRPHRSSRCLTTSPHTFLPMHFRLHNTSPSPLPPSQCFCHAYQDFGSGNLDFDIDATRALWSGTLTWTTPQLAPGEGHVHTALVAFTAPGLYGVGFSTAPLSTDPSDPPPATASAPAAADPTAEASPLVVHWSHETIEVVVASRPEDEAEEASTGRHGSMDMER